MNEENENRCVACSEIIPEGTQVCYKCLYDEDNKIINEIIFQLKCIKEHLKFISRTTDKSIDFDIQVLDGCIAQLEDTNKKK